LSVDWAKIVVLDDEVWTMLDVKAQMGGGPAEHLGECAVVACAHHRGLVAVLDERAAIAQAERLGVPVRDTLSVVVQAYKDLFGCDRTRAARVVDDLLDTEMKLPIDSGKSLFAWAYEQGLLP
jgi:predicted nucleic acid-binding protein